MSLMPLKLPPGIYRQGTDYQAQGRWISSNLMRWFRDTVLPVGGWVVATSNGDLDSPGRGLLAWRLFDISRAAAIGTVNKLWYFDDDQVHDITPTTLGAGNTDTLYGTGFGFGDFGEGSFGSSGTGGKADATTWSLDAYGQDLVAMASHDGKLYLWTLDTTVLPTQLTNSPEGRACFVTPERFIVVLGAGDPRTIAWCDLDDPTIWTAATTNQAGDYPLVTGGVALAGCRVRGQSLILTTTDAWTMTYEGPQAVYGFQQVGYDCGLVAPLALVSFLGGAAWPSYRGFYTFNGGVVAPVAGCTVADEIFRDVNNLQAVKWSGGHNSQFGEITWWYPSVSTGGMRAVTWNYVENHWTLDGQPARSCWTDSGVFGFPLAVNEAGRVYRQEDGFTAEGVSRVGTIYAETGPIELGSGDQVYMVRQCIPDELTPGQWDIQFATQFTPEGAVYNYGPYTLLPKTNMRVTGRQIAVKIRTTRDEEARIGTFRFDTISGGAR